MSDEIGNEKLTSCYETILAELGEDLDREGLHNTPMRAAKAMQANYAWLPPVIRRHC